jgi:hypothetical protein
MGYLINITFLLELLVALRPLSEPWPPVFFPPSTPMSRHYALICVTELFLIFRPLSSHLFLGLPGSLLPPRLSSRICVGILLCKVQ